MGTVMNTHRIIACLLCMLGASPARSEPSDLTSSLEEDFQRLRGKWIKRAPGHEWVINFDDVQAVQIGMVGPEPGAARASTGWVSEVKEDAQGRFIELQPFTAQAADLPQRLYYKFDQGDLVLDVSEGPLKGRHRFVKDKGYAPWVIGGVLLAAALLTTAMILLRKRAKKAASPRTSFPSD